MDHPFWKEALVALAEAKSAYHISSITRFQSLPIVHTQLIPHYPSMKNNPCTPYTNLDIFRTNNTELPITVANFLLGCLLYTSDAADE